MAEQKRQNFQEEEMPRTRSIQADSVVLLLEFFFSPQSSRCDFACNARHCHRFFRPQIRNRNCWFVFVEAEEWDKLQWSTKIAFRFSLRWKFMWKLLIFARPSLSFFHTVFLVTIETEFGVTNLLLSLPRYFRFQFRRRQYETGKTKVIFMFAGTTTRQTKSESAGAFNRYLKCLKCSSEIEVTWANAKAMRQERLIDIW